MVRSVWVVAAAVGLSFGVAPLASADPGAEPGTVVADAAPAAPITQAAQTAPAAQAAPAVQSAPSATSPSSIPDGVAHLPSPTSLPPGTTQAAPEPRTLGYLRDLFHAVRSDDVTMKDALLLLAQRPLDTPTSGMAPHSAPAPVAPTPSDDAAPESP